MHREDRRVRPPRPDRDRTARPGGRAAADADQQVILTAVRRLLHEGTGLPSVRAAVEVVGRTTHASLGTAEAVACRFDDATGCGSSPIPVPLDPEQPDRGLVGPDWPLWDRLRGTARPVLVADAADGGLVPPAAARKLGWGGYAALPLRRGDGPVVGVVVCAHRSPHRWTPTEEDLLDHLLEESALVVASAARREGDRLRMAELRRQALCDPLTGLPNRTLLFGRLEQAARVSARTGATLGVVVIDLDDFKRINDTLGHDAGDQVLVRVAESLRECLPDAETISRSGGDEFVVLLQDTCAGEATALARRIAERLCPLGWCPSDGDGRALGDVNATVGVATGTSRTGAGELLLLRADQARDRAKRTGQAVAVYQHERDGGILERDRLERELRHAVPDGGLRLVYQPVVDLANGSILGAEALLRWQHPRLGLLEPDRFLALAEQTELMVPLGRWVLGTGCRQLARWNERGLGDHPLNLAINISAVQLRRGGHFLEDLRGLLDHWGTDPRRLILEITETALLPDAHVPALLDEIRAMGVTIALDDFGVGYSSLRNLQRLPLDIVKIDRSFIADMGEQERSRALVAAVVSLGETLGLDVVAEGIETACQRDHLRSLGCPFGQGYLFAPPLEAPDLERLFVTSSRTGGLVDVAAVPVGERG